MRINTKLQVLISRVKLWSVVVLMGVLGVQTSQAQADGEKLFKANCSSCHKVDQNMTGPALQGVEDRWKGKEALLYEWIKNPAAVKAKNDPYVTKLLQEWEPKAGLMNAQAVSDDEITAILDYIKNWTPPVAQVTPDASPVPGTTEDPGISWTWLVIIGLILLIIIFSLSNVRSSLENAVLEKEGREALPDLTYSERFRAWAWKNKAFVSILALLLVVGGAVKGYQALMTVGVYTGYKPDQPIAFNHKLHAGENGIACVYCHHSAQKSKHAGIPSTNICMNCHKAINQGRSEQGTAEIQKIYAAVGWDPEAQAYTGEEQPVQWVKVHNLPDHAYFNHAQHYTVAGIQCQECHGPVDQEYTVGEQYASLTMGWCIDCHNQTAVNMTGNGYYDEIHQRLKDHGQDELKKYLEDGVITARELGGWECAKCHY